jgi:hypothetical protein
MVADSGNQIFKAMKKSDWTQVLFTLYKEH